MRDKFQHSRELTRIVEAKDWFLCDTTTPEERRTALTWDELEKLPVAKAFFMDRNYMFMPKPTKGQTKKEAYAVTKGFGPSIVLASIEEHLNMDGEGGLAWNGNLVYLFTRLFFGEVNGGKFLMASSPKTLEMPNPPCLVIPEAYVLEKFARHFKVLTPAEFYRHATRHQPYHRGISDN